jgi:hypothetical protein
MTLYKQKYKRNQVSWALGRTFGFTRGNISDAENPKFSYRIKRLLDMDYAAQKDDSKEPAFVENPLYGKGNEVRLSLFDSFCIGIALEMMEFDIKQHEILFFFQEKREDLKSIFKRIMKNPPPMDRQHHPYGDDTDMPFYEHNDQKYIDFTWYMAYNKSAFSELYPKAKTMETRNAIIFEPMFYWGGNHLKLLFDHDFVNHYKKMMVFEIAHIAGGLNIYLDKAIEIKRGRKR